MSEVDWGRKDNGKMESSCLSGESSSYSALILAMQKSRPKINRN